MSLQGQLASVGFLQTKFEQAKQEIYRLNENIVVLNSQIDDLTKRNNFAEHQTQNALDALHVSKCLSKHNIQKFYFNFLALI